MIISVPCIRDSHTAARRRQSCQCIFDFLSQLFPAMTGSLLSAQRGTISSARIDSKAVPLTHHVGLAAEVVSHGLRWLY